MLSSELWRRLFLSANEFLNAIHTKCRGYKNKYTSTSYLIFDSSRKRLVHSHNIVTLIHDEQESVGQYGAHNAELNQCAVTGASRNRGAVHLGTTPRALVRLAAAPGSSDADTPESIRFSYIKICSHRRCDATSKVLFVIFTFNQ